MVINIQVSDDNHKKIADLKTKHRLKDYNVVISGYHKLIKKLNLQQELEGVLKDEKKI